MMRRAYAEISSFQNIFPNLFFFFFFFWQLTSNKNSCLTDMPKAARGLKGVRSQIRGTLGIKQIRLGKRTWRTSLEKWSCMRQNFLFSLKQNSSPSLDCVTCLLADSAPQALAVYGWGSTQRDVIVSSCITGLFPISEQIMWSIGEGLRTRRSCLWQVMGWAIEEHGVWWHITS